MSRVLEQWDALILYFQAVSQQDHLLYSERINSMLQNPIWKLYFHFLNFALAKCTDLNTTASVYKECLSCFMSEAIWRYVENLDGIDPTSQTHHLSLKSMYVGAHVSLCLTQDIYKEQSRVFRNCSLLEVCPVSKDLTNLCVVFFFHFSMSPR